ncbi:MAG: ribonuclease H-like domain-containing protein [Acidobacteria bacterium]|nr:ribonuclease H-like domain-containing protein [Acidobacteriota bacterium]MDA1235160.1 ribonuclease H-like domain-containing protein [Acidobacteriota bacterium]
MTPITTADIDRLRRRIERVEGGRMEPSPAPRTPTFEDFTYSELFAQPRVDHYDVEQYLDGKVIENKLGSYFLAERFYPNHKLHGSFEISRLAAMPGHWLEGISKGDIPACDPSRWAFLDTETTGLAGGTGTCAFLIGVGTIEPEGFRVRLFFMRDYDEEAPMLRALSEFLADYEVLVTYNGKSYDAPLLETRFLLRRQPNPLQRMHHLDLLHGSRSLWKLRLESCRLIHLECEILGMERQGDLPGELIPHYYFEYLRTRQAFKLVPMFHHNAMDILSLACLTEVVLPSFAAPEDAALHHGADLLGLARWLRRSGDHAAAAALYRKALQADMADSELFAALWESALIERKRGCHEQKRDLLLDLAACRNPYQAKALTELAKHYERCEKDLPQALDAANQAAKLDPGEQTDKRIARLQRRVARTAAADPRLACET